MPHWPMGLYIQNMSSWWPLPGRARFTPPNDPKICPPCLAVAFCFPQNDLPKCPPPGGCLAGAFPQPPEQKHNTKTPTKQHPFLLVVVTWQGPFCSLKNTPYFVFSWWSLPGRGLFVPPKRLPFSPDCRCLAGAFFDPPNRPPNQFSWWSLPGRGLFSPPKTPHIWSPFEGEGKRVKFGKNGCTEL